jgi:ATP/maltotriose-dependent transcriptional regulator MalT
VFTPDFKEILDILQDDLAGALLVVDDSHRSKDIERFLSFLKDGDIDAKVLVNSNKKPGFYNRSNVVVDKLVEEMYLRGLNEGASKELLKVKGFAFTQSSFDKLYKLTKGHPTALMLMASKDYSSSYRDFLRYLNEEVLGDLTTEEERLLRQLCVFRGAFSHELIKESDTITLHRLIRKSLVQDRGDELAVPELVADYFCNHLEKGERKNNHSAAADYYLDKDDNFERLYHLVKADREFEAVSLALRKKDEFMSKPKEFHELIKNLRPKDRYAPNFNIMKKNVFKRLDQQ